VLPRVQLILRLTEHRRVAAAYWAKAPVKRQGNARERRSFWTQSTQTAFSKEQAAPIGNVEGREMGRQGARAVPVLQLAVPLPRGVAVGAPSRERAGDQVPAQRARAAHGHAVVVVQHQADEQAVLVVRPAAVVATAVPARRLLRLRPAPRGGTAAGSCQELRGLRARP